MLHIRHGARHHHSASSFALLAEEPIDGTDGERHGTLLDLWYDELQDEPAALMQRLDRAGVAGASRVCLGEIVEEFRCGRTARHRRAVRPSRTLGRRVWRGSALASAWAAAAA